MTALCTQRLSGWGRTTTVDTATARPERLADVKKAVTAAGTLPRLAYGNLRSYGDCPLVANGGRSVLMTRMNRLISFDPISGELVAEAGITFADLQNIFLPRGWMVPVSPGTAFVTLGGAIANDVHGKNHLSAGSFGRHVQWLDLLLVSGQEVRVSRQSDPDLFAATVGGLGLTGVILRASVALRKVVGAEMMVTGHRLPDLEAMMAAFRDRTDSDDYDIAWLDLVRGGARMGRGIFERAHVTEGPYTPPRPALGMPIDLPPLALNRFSIRAFNSLRYHLVGKAEATVRQQSVNKFLYPLDSILNWNRLYGKRGFHQFQAVIPDAEADRGIKKLVEAIVGSHRGSFLTTLKRLGAAGDGYLSFPMSGYTLALDFPNGDAVPELMQRLERITLDHGGRIYLAKDSCLSAAGFASMYPRLPDFRAVLERVDPEGRMSSAMAVRLGIRGRA